MRLVLSVALALIAGGVLPVGGAAQDSLVTAQRPAAFSTAELDNLLAPVALYPDPILAQVLVAATFPDQIEVASEFVKANGTRNIDEQEWDVSVKAVAHYPPVLNLMAERSDWTTALGQAYAAQSTDVMESVQRLRQMAHAQGNLETTREQKVVVENQAISIVPAQPQVIYVPTYDPTIVYYRSSRIVHAHSGFWSFGVGFPIGAWLSYDCDWYGRRIYYDGWHGGGWRIASRPFISITAVYVHPRYRDVYINRRVFHRRVNYVSLRRYNAIHERERFDRYARDGRWNDRNDRNDRNGGWDGGDRRNVDRGSRQGDRTGPFAAPQGNRNVLRTETRGPKAQADRPSDRQAPLIIRSPRPAGPGPSRASVSPPPRAPGGVRSQPSGGGGMIRSQPSGGAAKPRPPSSGSSRSSKPSGGGSQRFGGSRPPR
jgi:hypothetical protein